MRDFDLEQRERQAAEPDDRQARGFRLAGRVMFRARHVPAEVLFMLEGFVGAPDASDMPRIRDSIELMLEPESVPVFHDAISGKPLLVADDEGNVVGEEDVDRPDMPTLFALLTYLVEQATDRPFTQQSASPASPVTPASGMRSRGGALQTVEVPSPTSQQVAS